MLPTVQGDALNMVDRVVRYYCDRQDRIARVARESRGVPRVDRLPVYRYGGLLHVNRANYHVLLILLFRQTFNRMAGEEPELSRE